MNNVILKVETNANQNSEFHVTQASSRIGSSDSCDFVIDHESVPALAMILEYRKGKFVVHNQDSQPIKKAGKVVDRTSFNWDPSETLQYGKLLKLKLSIAEAESNASVDVEDLKAASESPSGRPIKETESDLAAAKKKKNQMLMLTILLLLFGGYLAYEEFSPKPDPVGDSTVTYEQALEECETNGNVKIREQIQYAESRFNNGDYAGANQQFLELRNNLDSTESFAVTLEYLSGRIADTAQ